MGAGNKVHGSFLEKILYELIILCKSGISIRIVFSPVKFDRKNCFSHGNRRVWGNHTRKNVKNLMTRWTASSRKEEFCHSSEAWRTCVMAESRVAINLPPVQPGWHSLTVDTHIHSLQVLFLLLSLSFMSFLFICLSLVSLRSHLLLFFFFFLTRTNKGCRFRPWSPCFHPPSSLPHP